jgi:hypothetical protein
MCASSVMTNLYNRVRPFHLGTCTDPVDDEAQMSLELKNFAWEMKTTELFIRNLTVEKVFHTEPIDVSSCHDQASKVTNLHTVSKSTLRQEYLRHSSNRLHSLFAWRADVIAAARRHAPGSPSSVPYHASTLPAPTSPRKRPTTRTCFPAMAPRLCCSARLARLPTTRRWTGTL